MISRWLNVELSSLHRADRLAYVFSLVGELQAEHAKRVEESRIDLKRMQKAEAELAPKRAARVKIHKELMTLIPERAKVNSTKIAPLEAQLEGLEADDKVLEEELGKLKREALKSSYDAQCVQQRGRQRCFWADFQLTPPFLQL